MDDPDFSMTWKAELFYMQIAAAAAAADIKPSRWKREGQ